MDKNKREKDAHTLGDFNCFCDWEKSKQERFAAWRTKIIEPIAPTIKALGISPDQISYLGLLFLIPAVIFFESHPWLTTLSIIIFSTLDGIEGAYARATGQASNSGAFTDTFCDQLELVVISLCVIHYGFIHPTIGAWFIAIYLLMVFFAVAQNALGIPVQLIFRCKYYLFLAHLIWWTTGRNYMDWLMTITSVIMIFSVVWSYIRLKKGIRRIFDKPPKG